MTDLARNCQWVDSHHELLDDATGKGPVHVFHQVLGPTQGDNAVLDIPFDIIFSFLGVHWRFIGIVNLRTFFIDAKLFLQIPFRPDTLLTEIIGTPPIKKDFDVPCSAKGILHYYEKGRLLFVDLTVENLLCKPIVPPATVTIRIPVILK